MNLLKLFKRDTNYKPQQLSDKQKSLLDELDMHLSGNSATIPADGSMVIKTAKIGLIYTMRGESAILENILKQLPESYSYIPRSIAFLCDPDGNWCYYVAVREVGETNVLVDDFFTDALIRTNAARVE